MRLVTTDELPGTAFTLAPDEVAVNTVQRRVTVRGESARRMRNGLGGRLALRTFVLADESAGIELIDCHIRGEDDGADSLTIIYRRGRQTSRKG